MELKVQGLLVEYQQTAKKLSAHHERYWYIHVYAYRYINTFKYILYIYINDISSWSVPFHPPPICSSQSCVWSSQGRLPRLHHFAYHQPWVAACGELNLNQHQKMLIQKTWQKRDRHPGAVAATRCLSPVSNNTVSSCLGAQVWDWHVFWSIFNPFSFGQNKPHSATSSNIGSF